MRSILRLRWPAGAALLLLLIPVLLIVGATQGNSAEPLFLPVVSSCNFAPGSAPPSPQALIRVTPTGASSPARTMLIPFSSPTNRPMAAKSCPCALI